MSDLSSYLCTDKRHRHSGELASMACRITTLERALERVREQIKSHPMLNHDALKIIDDALGSAPNPDRHPCAVCKKLIPKFEVVCVPCSVRERYGSAPAKERMRQETWDKWGGNEPLPSSFLASDEDAPAKEQCVCVGFEQDACAALNGPCISAPAKLTLREAMSQMPGSVLVSPTPVTPAKAEEPKPERSDEELVALLKKREKLKPGYRFGEDEDEEPEPDSICRPAENNYGCPNCGGKGCYG
jgi:hypothetical protein